MATMTMSRTLLQELVDHVFFQSTRTPSYSIVVFLFRLRSFDSGVLVIQSISHSDEEVIKKTKELVGLSLLMHIKDTMQLFHVCLTYI